MFVRTWIRLVLCTAASASVGCAAPSDEDGGRSEAAVREGESPAASADADKLEFARRALLTSPRELEKESSGQATDFLTREAAERYRGGWSSLAFEETRIYIVEYQDTHENTFFDLYEAASDGGYLGGYLAREDLPRKFGDCSRITTDPFVGVDAEGRPTRYPATTSFTCELDPH